MHFTIHWRWREDRWACPQSSVTFDLHLLLVGEVRGEAMAVTEENTSAIVWRVGPEERQQRCEVCMIVRRWCCSAHTGNEVSYCVGGVVERSCVHFGHVGAVWFCEIACGLPVDFWYPVNTWLRMGVLETQDGLVVGVVWPLPSGPLRVSTSGYSSHTPVTEVIKWAWLDILHLSDVFDVVSVSQCSPSAHTIW